MHFGYVIDGYRKHFERRIMPNVSKAPHELLPGEYAKWGDDGNWYGVPPDTDLIANLSGHTVVEHDDGTISVEPSILVSNDKESWHGYLKRGQWEKC